MAEHTLSILVKTLGAAQASKEIGSLSAAANRTVGGVGRLGGAFGHFKGVIGSLLSPTGIVGLGGGIAGLGLTLDKVIEHTNDFAFSVEKLTNLTGGSAESMSTLLAVFEKFNIDAERTGQIVGFAEKTLGKLAHTSSKAGKSAGDLAKEQERVTRAHQRLVIATLNLKKVQENGKHTTSQYEEALYRVRNATVDLRAAESKLAADRKNKGSTSVSKLIELDKEYGLHLIDTKGKLVDFGEELRQVADVYTSSLDPAKKAFLAAQLFGRGYADLVPILALGRKGIDDASQAAKDLGLTLTSENAKDLKDYREALRESADAIGGLELQIGLALVPAIKDMASAITTFLRNGGRETIVSFFRNAVAAARSLGETIRTVVIPVFTGIKAGWESIPKEFRDLIVGGLVANKTVKFLFGFSPISFAADALSKSLGTIIGKNIVQPVFVTNQVPGGGLPGAAGAAGGLGLLSATGIAAAIVLASVPIGQAFAGALPDWLKGPGGAGKSQSQIAHEAAQAAADAAAGKPYPTGPAGNVTPSFSAFDLGKIGNITPEISRLTGVMSGVGGTLKGERTVLDGIHRDFVSGLHNLAHELDPAKVIAETNKVVHAVEKGVGSSEHTKDAIVQLRAKLNDVHDPKAQAVLRAAIAKLEAKVPGRQYVEREIAQAKKIAASTESTKNKVHDLKTIEHNLLAHGDKHAASQIAHLIQIQKNTLATAIGINAVRGAGGSTAPGAGHPGGSYHPPSKPSTASNPYTKYAVGSWNVPITGPAIVHAAEMIIPAREAQRIRASFRASRSGTAAPAITAVSVYNKFVLSGRTITAEQRRENRVGTSSVSSSASASQ